MVRHNDVAWHAHNANGDGIGIEHCANRRGLDPTEAQYNASAALVRWLSDTYGIPVDAPTSRGTRKPTPIPTTTAPATCGTGTTSWT